MSTLKIPAVLLVWVEEEIFIGGANDAIKLSPTKLAEAATATLGLSIKPGDVAVAVGEVNRWKNYDLKRYPYNDDKDVFNNPPQKV